MAGIGAAFTGTSDGSDDPTRNIVADSASALNKALFSDPQSRAALLQIGLNMMQPVGFGQSTVGHIGSAIGAGGEAQARIEKEDLEAEKVAQKKLLEEQELDLKSRGLDIRQQEADAYKDRLTQQGQESKAELERQKQQGRWDIKTDHELMQTARAIAADTVNSDQNMKTYGTLDPYQIYLKLRDQHMKLSGVEPPGGGGGGGGGGGKPKSVKQNGHIYYLQPDGSYK